VRTGSDNSAGVYRYDRTALTQRLGTSERQGYAIALAGLWSSLSGTLVRLEAIAADPEVIDEAVETLPALQYELHCAGELALGLDPPAGTETAHAELAAALEDARDATGDVLDAIESCGAEALEGLVHEWRGALFRVRLARMRLSPRREAAALVPEALELPDTRASLLTTVLVAGGTIAFAGGAVAGLWEVWALGLVLVSAGFLSFRQ
jgi:hypothetical protein